MRPVLIIPGKVQVDIRLFVALKAQKCLKRNVKTVLVKRRPAYRAHFIRHVASGPSREGAHLLRVKVAVVTLGTYIVRREGIHFRDARHRGHQGGADRSPRTHEVAVFVGFPHQFLRDDIHHGKAVGDDGGEFPLEAVFHRLRQRVAVDPMRPLITDLAQCLIRIRNLRRALVRTRRVDAFAHVHNPVRVRDDNLPRLLLPQIGKLREHLLRRAKIQRRLRIRVLEALTVHDDAAVHLIGGIQKVNIAGGCHRAAHPLAQIHDPAVYVPDVILRLHRFPLVAQHEHIVSYGLDLKIVVKIGDPADLLLRPAAHHRAVQFPRLTGGTHQDAFAILHQFTFRHAWAAVKIVEMRQRHQPVEVHASDVVLRQQDGVIRGQLLHHFRGRFVLSRQVIQRSNVPLLQHLREAQKDERGALGVVHRPMMILQRNMERFGHRIQSVSRKLRQENPRERYGIHHGEVTGKPHIVAVFPQKAHVKIRVVRHHYGGVAKREELWQDLRDGRRGKHHVVVNTGQLFNLIGNGYFGIDKGGKTLRDTSVLQAYRANLDDPVFLGRKARGLQIEHHERIGETLPGRVCHGAFQIVHEIGLHPVDYPKVAVRCHLFGRFRKGLHIAVIRDGDGPMAPLPRAGNDIAHVGHPGQVAQFGKEEQFHPLLRRAVPALFQERGNPANPSHGADGQFPVVRVESRHAVHRQKRPGRHMLPQGGEFRVLTEHFDPDTVRLIGEHPFEDGTLVANRLLFHLLHPSADHHIAHLFHNLVEGNRIAVKGPAPDQIRILGATGAARRLFRRGCFPFRRRVLFHCLCF